MKSGSWAGTRTAPSGATGWSGGGGPRGVLPPARTRAGRVAVTTSVTQGVSGVVGARSTAPQSDRDQRVRVPDRRPDRARAGAPRRGGRPRAARPDGSIPPNASPRRSTSVRRSSAARRCRTAQATATMSRRSPTAHEAVRSASPTRTRRSAQSIRRARARRRLRHRWHVKYCSPRRARFPYVRRELLEATADPDRLVRRRGHLPDGHLGLLAAADARRFDAGTPPVPNIYAGSPASRSSRRRVPAIEEHISDLATRLIDGLDDLDATVATPRDPSHAARSLRRSTDVGALVAALAGAHRAWSATRTSGSRSTSTTSTKTSTAARRARAAPPPTRLTHPPTRRCGRRASRPRREPQLPEACAAHSRSGVALLHGGLAWTAGMVRPYAAPKRPSRAVRLLA